jgi:TPR repeat protein
LYAQGWGVEQDFDVAREWYEKAAAGGSPRAYFNLARMYALGMGVEKDCDKAVEYWRKPAEQGDPIAQVNIGSLYMDGFECIPKDVDEGVRWYRLAAEQGDPLAQHSMGALYALGQGVEQSYEKALEWYEKAAAQGHERAIQALEGLKTMQGGLGAEVIDEMVDMYLAAPAAAVAAESISLSNLSMMLDFGFNIVMGDLEINDSNRELIRAEVAAKREAIKRAVEVRGAADIAGAYKVKATSACSNIQSGWADGTRQGFLGKPTFTQDGHEVTMTQMADFNGKEPVETPAVVVENALTFVDMMNTEFYFVGEIKGDVITITPDTDRILAAWPDWVKAPSRKNLNKCKITLTRQ